MCPQKSVAVIGAGISGVNTAAHLKAAGVSTTVFERAPTAGGVWLYDPRPAPEPLYPATLPSKAELINLDACSQDSEELSHAPSGPCYDGLTNNVGTRMMKTTLSEWPQGTPDYVSHSVLKDYIQTITKNTGVEEVTRYSTKVTKLEKVGSKWRLEYSRFQKCENGSTQVKAGEQLFDSVVVATGHYHAPKVPSIPGLRQWKSTWSNRIIHSKGYRSPEAFRDKTVLLIGAGVSSLDISKELGKVAKRVYQSSRGGKFDLPAKLLPENAVRVGEIDHFEYVEGLADHLGTSDNGSIPNRAVLKSGQTLCDIDRVIVCTGYHVTFPFLLQYHQDETPATEANETVLVTDGTQVHNLHKDIWYIPDPSLVFVGIPYYSANFSLFEFQAIAVAAVLSDRATLPSEQDMRIEYQKKVQEKGIGKSFHSLNLRDAEYANELLEWINRDGTERGLKSIPGHTQEWHEARQDHISRKRLVFGDSTLGEPFEEPLLSTC